MLIDFKNFPTTRYQGSKRKLLPWLYKHFKNIQFETVLDACGGSGVVSYLFKKMGKQVTYNDELKFNFFIGKAIIENSKVRLTEKDIEDLIKNENPQLNCVIQENFQNIFYLNNENRWLDKVITNVINMNHYSEDILDYKKALAYYALFQSCLIKRPFNLFHRKNLYLRTNIVKRSFGNKVTWDKSFSNHFKKFSNEANSLIFTSEKICKATNESILKIKNSNYDLVYIDSPYLSKCNSGGVNYLNYYHFLEGICNYEIWDKLINYNSKNHTFELLNENNEFDKKNIYNTFKSIFEKFKKSKIVISYKYSGIPSISFFKNTLKDLGKSVISYSVDYNYALSKANSIPKKEILIIAE